MFVLSVFSYNWSFFALRKDWCFEFQFLDCTNLLSVIVLDIVITFPYYCLNIRLWYFFLIYWCIPGLKTKKSRVALWSWKINEFCETAFIRNVSLTQYKLVKLICLHSLRQAVPCRAQDHKGQIVITIRFDHIQESNLLQLGYGSDCTFWP